MVWLQEWVHSVVLYLSIPWSTPLISISWSSSDNHWQELWTLRNYINFRPYDMIKELNVVFNEWIRDLLNDIYDFDCSKDTFGCLLKSDHKLYFICACDLAWHQAWIILLNHRSSSYRIHSRSKTEICDAISGEICGQTTVHRPKLKFSSISSISFTPTTWKHVVINSSAYIIPSIKGK